MKRLLTIMAFAALGAAAAGCTESKRASQAATFGDQPADITCWSFGSETYSGRSTGKVEYDEGGRVSFVDAASGRFTTLEGDCRIVYLTDDDQIVDAPPRAPSAPPPPTS